MRDETASETKRDETASETKRDETASEDETARRRGRVGAEEGPRPCRRQKNKCTSWRWKDLTWGAPGEEGGELPVKKAGHPVKVAGHAQEVERESVIANSE